jgi:Uri superfamily endonuclease
MGASLLAQEGRASECGWLMKTHTPHWHIDYLIGVAEPVEVWYTTDTQKLEHHWAELLEKAPHFRVPIPRFGCSDYHRSRSSHLFHSKRRPSFRWFQQEIQERFDDVQAERHLITEDNALGLIHGR